MTSRQRVLATLKRQQPDRVPLDLGGTESSGLTAMAYNRLRKHMRLPQGRTQVFDVYQQVVRIEDDLRELLEIDTVPLHFEPAAWQAWTLPDGSPCEIPAGWNPRNENGDWVVRDGGGNALARMPAGGFYFEPVFAPLADVEDPSRLDAYQDAIASSDWPAFADEGLDAMTRRAKHLCEHTSFAIVLNLQCHFLAAAQGLRGYENFMVDLLANQDMARALMERLTEAYIQRCDRILSRLGKYVQVVLFNDDLGTQNGPMLSLDVYKELIHPYQKRLFGHVKRTYALPILFHSCGAVAEFIPSLIDAGVDALNPVQVSAAGMDSADLKRQFGRDITFWGGGCNTQAVLNRGSRQEIETEVDRRVRDLRAGGGFVFTQVHNIQPDVPPENILAMYDAFKKIRDY